MSPVLPAAEPLPQGRPATLPVVARLLVGMGRKLARWQERRRTRAALARLDPHLLADIGLDGSDREAERLKPFWRA